MIEVRLTIKKDVAFWEYGVKYYLNGVYSEAKSYFTDDRDDAVQTRDWMRDEAEAAGYSVVLAGKVGG